MKLVVAVDNEWGIGYKGDLLARVSMDLKNFRILTKGKTSSRTLYRNRAKAGGTCLRPR